MTQRRGTESASYVLALILLGTGRGEHLVAPRQLAFAGLSDTMCMLVQGRPPQTRSISIGSTKGYIHTVSIGTPATSWVRRWGSFTALNILNATSMNLLSCGAKQNKFTALQQ